MFLTILREGYRDIPCTICPSYAYSFLFLTLTELPPQPPPHSDPLVTLSVLTVVHMTLRYFSLFAWTLFHSDIKNIETSQNELGYFFFKSKAKISSGLVAVI